MRTFIMMILSLLLWSYVFSQPIDTWERRYGGDLNEGGKQIIRMNDGNYLINCSIRTPDDNDIIWVIAINEDGDSLWTKKIGVDGPASFYINDMDCSLESSIYIARVTNYFGQTGYVSKKTSTFDEVWTKSFTNVPSFGAGVNTVVCSNDSGCVLSGYYQESFEYSSGFIEKLDKNGNSVAYRTLENTLFDSLFALSNDVRSILMQPGTSGDEYTVVGNYEVIDSSYTVFPYIATYGDSLEVLIEQNIFQDKGYDFRGLDIVNSMYVIFGDSKLFNLDRSLSYSSWSTELSPSIHSVKQTSNEDFFVGTTSKTYKMDKDAGIIWEKDFGSNSLIPTADGGCLAVGSKFGDVWICKFDQDGNYTNIENFVYEVSGYELHQNYPNPFNPTTEISYSLKTAGQVTLSVFNAKGELVRTLVNEKKPAGNHSIKFNGDGLKSGLYFYQLVVEDKVVASMKMMMLK